MAGHAGAGKSTLARQIAADARGVVIDLDTIKTSLLDAGATWDDASAWSYAVIYGLVDDILTGSDALVVVDTPSYWREIHEQLTSAADRHGADYVFVECVADDEVRGDRIARRATRRSQVRDHARRPVDAPDSMQPPHLRTIERPSNRACVQVDTNGSVDTSALWMRPPLDAHHPGP
jgi:predicted kinase